MSTVSTPAEQRIIFNDVSWETYLALASETDRPGKRIAFDQGVMEIMSPGILHENVGIYDGDSLVVYRYTQGGHYDEAAQSSVLPQFPLVAAIRCLDKRNDASQTELIRTFLDGVRQRKQG